MDTRSSQGKTRSWSEKDQRYVWHAMARHTQDGPPSPMMVESADGAWITDASGERYLDGMSGLWCVNAGYGREELAKAAYDQLVKLPYYPLTGSHEPAVELGEKLGQWLDPTGSSEYVIFYSNSGSEANEAAFKIARQYHEQTGEPSRHKFVARYRAYHGNGFGSLAATGQAQRKYRYEPLAPGFLHVEPPDPYRVPEGMDPDKYGLECARQIERVIAWEMPETIAAVIMEPLITGGGILIPPEDYMAEVQRICRENGVLLISDEVICGFGRTGENFGFQNYGVSPDIVTMAKGITSGYLPLSATAVKREIYEAFAGTGLYDNLRHVNTFGGNPTSCALAIKNLEIMEEEELPRRSREMGDRLRQQIRELEDHPNVGEIRHKGLLFGVEMVEDKQTKEPSQQKAAALMAACKKRGLVVGKNGDTVAGYNNVVALSPPLSITEDDLEFIAATFREAATEI
ncbi:MAG: aspartate aminotransferase family protein [Rubrobacter sp.]|nr:aspartate aminotransferase family protein [Rubrobacter sp.]